MGQKQSYELPHEATKETARKASLDHCIGSEATRIRSFSQEEKSAGITVGTLVCPEPLTEVDLGGSSTENAKKEIIVHKLFPTPAPEEYELPSEMRPSQSHMP